MLSDYLSNNWWCILNIFLMLHLHFFFELNAEGFLGWELSSFKDVPRSYFISCYHVFDFIDCLFNVQF